MGKIGRRRNTAVAEPQSKVNAMTEPTQPTQTSHRSSHLTVIFLAFRKRWAIDKKDGRNTIPCGTELKAGMLVENISGLSRRTITCAGRSPKCSHQSSLCPPCGYSSGAICPHIRHAPKTALRPPIRNIRRRRNNWWISSFPSQLPFLYHRGQGCTHDSCVILPHIPLVSEMPQPPIRKIRRSSNAKSAMPASALPFRHLWDLCFSYVVFEKQFVAT